MKLDDLKIEWQNEVAPDKIEENLSSGLELLEKETIKLDKLIKRRDILEISTALLLLPFWMYALLNSAGYIHTLGLCILIIACIFIPYKLLKAKQIDTRKDTNMRAFLEIEKLKVEKQKELTKTLVSWYLAPILIGVIIAHIGVKVDQSGIPQITTDAILYYAVCIVLSIGIYLLNKRGVKKHIDPILEKLNHSLQEMED